MFRVPLNDFTNAFKAYRRKALDGCRPFLSPHFNLTVELPLKTIVRGYSWTVMPITWRNRRSGISKLKISEMGSRYLFIALVLLAGEVFQPRRLQKGAVIRSEPVIAVWLLLIAVAGCSSLHAQTGENVLLVVNRKSALSRQIADYYRPLRSVPAANVCYLDTTTDEEIDWKTYQDQIERPIGDCLTKAGLQEKVLYIVLTAGVPLKIAGIWRRDSTKPNKAPWIPN